MRLTAGHVPAAGLAVLSLGVALVGCPGATTSLPDAGDPLEVGAIDGPAADVRMGACSGDDECSDGLFCNGRERCEPTSASADDRGCAPPRGRPCLDVQVCEEATDACITDCGADRDADDDLVDAEICGGLDCDDADPLRYAGNVEVCDAEDRDEDCDATTFGDRDLDRDGAIDVRCCNVDAAGARACGDDCNDVLRNVRPLGAELCDGLDNDCNDVADEGVTVSRFADVDRDLHGDPAVEVMACAGAAGVSPYDDDCDDTRRDVHGAQLEICDAIDNDCDRRVDENAQAVTWYRDADGDGFGAAASGTMVSCAPLAGFSLLPTDCDDTNRARSPIATEICDGVDGDCNGLADWALGASDREDDDGDGHADVACGGDDCDDGDWSTYPDAPEVCDFRDSDCNGLADRGVFPATDPAFDATVEIDWFADVDQDAWGASPGAVRSCEPRVGRVNRAGDCADLDASRHPGAVDLCDGVDDDCDSSVDEDAPSLAFYADGDDDGDGDGTPVLACSSPPDLVATPGDCAPADPMRGPSEIETCNTIDDDCDGATDEMLFTDADGDGHGDPRMPSGASCVPGDVGVGDDCDDTDPTVGEASTCVEICNGVDDDGDLMTDEPGAEASCPNAATSTWSCAAGACVLLGCRGMAGDCNGITADGCEGDLANDPRRCGTCTTACDIGEACTMGACGDPIVDIECGALSTMARRRSGSVVYWGRGGAYSAGTADPDSYIPRVSSLSSPTSIDLRMGRGCAMVSGTRLCWGASLHPTYYGSTILGEGAVADVVTPTPLEAGPFIDVSLGNSYSCGVLATGQVLCWGGPSGGFSALGDGLGVGSTSPVSVLGLSDATAVAAGNHHTCAIRTGGHVVCWGTNGTRLGIGVTGSRDYPLEEVELVSGLPLTNVVELVVTAGNALYGGATTFARRGDGSVMSWGESTHGELGVDGGTAPVGYAVSVVDGPGVTTPMMDARHIDAGYMFACVERVSGGLACWGNNQYGQLGLGTTTDVHAPTPVPVPAFDDWCLGDEHACVLLPDGRVLCWGYNGQGQCGQDGVMMVPSPTEVMTLRRGPP